MSGIFVYEGPEQAAEALGGRAYTPEGPSVDERISQISELSEDSIDRALAKVSAPAEEPEPEAASLELPAEPDEGERAAFERAGTSYEEAAAFLAQNPELGRHLIAEPRTDEELAQNAALLAELKAGREAGQALGQVAGVVNEQQAEEWFENVLDAVYESGGDDPDAMRQAAAAVAEITPARLDEFLEVWGDFDPVGPHLFRQQQANAQAEAQEWIAQATYAQQVRDAEAAQNQATLAAFEGALKGLGLELKDPTRRVDLTPVAADLVTRMVEQSPPGSPEEARQLVQLARRGTREIGEAREVARTFFAPLDEQINRQGFRDGRHDDGTPYEPIARARLVDAATAEQINLDRILPSGPSGFDRMLDVFDRELDRQEAARAENDPGNSPTLRAAHEARVAERNAQARRIA